MDKEQREERLKKLEKLLIPQARKEMMGNIGDRELYVVSTKKHYNFVLEYTNLLHEQSIEYFQKLRTDRKV